MNKTIRQTFEVYAYAFAFIFASRQLSDPDFWWHLKTGEYIVKTLRFPRVDFYSFTLPGKPWVAHEWLSEVIFYLVYSRVGPYALIFIFTALIVLAFGIVFRRLAVHPFIKAFAMLQVIGALSVEVNTGMRFSRGLSILQVAQRRYGIKAKRKPAALQELRKLYADTFGVETKVGAPR